MYKIRVFPCNMCLGVMRLGDGLTCLYWLSLIMKKRVIKGNVINYWSVICWEWFEWLVERLCCCKLCVIIKMVIFSLFVNMSFAFFLYMVVTGVMWIEKECEIKEDVPFQGTYCAPWLILYFEKRIAFCDGYYILRNVSCAVMVTIMEDPIARRDGCMDNVTTRSTP